MSVLFKETQKLMPNWLIYSFSSLILLTNLAVIYAFRGLSPGLDLMFFMITPLIPFIFYFIRLETEIDESEIKINFAYFYKRTIPFNEISNMYIRKYRPIIEYGGWGLKGWKKSNRAYNMRGNTGLQLELVNSDRALIGTQKQEELTKVLEYIQRRK